MISTNLEKENRLCIHWKNLLILHFHHSSTHKSSNSSIGIDFFIEFLGKLVTKMDSKKDADNNHREDNDGSNWDGPNDKSDSSSSNNNGPIPFYVLQRCVSF